jgi:hypothetical protein
LTPHNTGGAGSAQSPPQTPEPLAYHGHDLSRRHDARSARQEGRFVHWAPQRRSPASRGADRTDIGEVPALKLWAHRGGSGRVFRGEPAPEALSHGSTVDTEAADFASGVPLGYLSRRRRIANPNACEGLQPIIPESTDQCSLSCGQCECGHACPSRAAPKCLQRQQVPSPSMWSRERICRNVTAFPRCIPVQQELTMIEPSSAASRAGPPASGAMAGEKFLSHTTDGLRNRTDCAGAGQVSAVTALWC